MNFVGNMLSRIYTPYTDIAPAIVYPGKIRIYYRGWAELQLKTRDFMSIGWQAVDTAYNYTSLTYRKHLKINKYKLLISITFPFSTADDMHQIKYLLNYINRTETNFQTLEENNPIYITLAGDRDTAPVVKCKLRNFGEFVPNHLADRYVGYDSYTLEFESFETYNTMELEFRTPPPTVIPETIGEVGITETAMLTPELEVFD